MKKHYLLLFLLTFFAAQAWAQIPTFPGGGGGRPSQQPAVIPGTADDVARGNGKISGTLVDSVSKQPIEFAAISLVEIKSNKPIDGTTTDDKGNFSLTKIAEGDYNLLISFIGYKGKQVKKVSIGRRATIELGEVVLIPDVVQLNAVNVVGQAEMIEERVDRLVYNAEKDIASKGGDATEVMRKVPMLSVDLDGNVSLRGSSNVRVLINNKPSTILANSVADALKQIPADMIKSVEVITSPSAKYDAEGTAGIINIITKKNTLQGATLDLNTGVGNRGSNLGLRGSYRTGKMGFNLGGFGRATYNVIGKGENIQEGNRNGSPFSTRQTTESLNTGGFGSYNLGWDYDITEKSFVTASVRYGVRNQNNTQSISTISSFGNNPATNSFRDVTVTDLSGTVDVNIDYTRQLKKPQQEFSILSQFSRNNRTNDFDADLFSSSTSLELLGQEGNRNGSYNQESTIQLDYQSPIKKTQMIEFGAKGIFREVNSDFTYFSTIATPRPANELNYDQNVAATYLSYTFSTKNKYSFKIGSRYEYTTIMANQGEADLAIPDYGNLVPSVNISKTFKGGKTVKLGYNRRLQRPGIQFLNPNINAANPQNITVGNPNLAPELTDQYELSTSWFKKSVYLNLSLFARNTNNSIESIRSTDEQGVITTTYGNIGQKQNYGLNLFGNVTLFSKWQLGGGLDTYYAYLSNNSGNTALGTTNSGMVISGRIFTNLTIKNGWGLQGFGFIRGRDVQLQGTQTGFAFYSLGAKKDFANKRGSVGIGAENFLAKAFRVETILDTPNFTQTNINNLYNRGVRINFSYKLGKMSFDEQPRRRRKSVNNDDVKSGGDGGGGDGGGQPQQAAPAAGGGRPRGK
ncbi:TonB-dependent receptor domain-containing protein [Arundinibacter roseus]|uniref:TonB-dependent receptor n=1 Tax=Arundinibacter roseus TaxID=2070510 RepID=A0A4R4K9X0_9BACT|nr:outer membrane beta-barrel family protein [Arundinibacter roseus]TDB63442.1 TonB-dependent receptor [Arundinibacter roseus]